MRKMIIAHITYTIDDSVIGLCRESSDGWHWCQTIFFVTVTRTQKKCAL